MDCYSDLGCFDELPQHLVLDATDTNIMTCFVNKTSLRGVSSNDENGERRETKQN